MIRYVLICCFLLSAVIAKSQYKFFWKKTKYFPDKERFFKIKAVYDRAHRINRSNSAVHLLDSEDTLAFRVNAPSKRAKLVADDVRSHFATLRSDFRNNVLFITPSVIEDYQQACFTLGDGQFGEVFEGRGTLIRPIADFGTMTTFYDIRAVHADTTWTVRGLIAYFYTKKGSEIPVLNYYGFMAGEGPWSVYLDPADKAQGMSTQEVVVQCLHFLRYLKSLKKSVILAPSKHMIKQDSQYYLNETGLDIQIIKAAEKS